MMLFMSVDKVSHHSEHPEIKLIYIYSLLVRDVVYEDYSIIEVLRPACLKFPGKSRLWSEEFPILLFEPHIFKMTSFSDNLLNHAGMSQKLSNHSCTYVMCTLMY